MSYPQFAWPLSFSSDWTASIDFTAGSTSVDWTGQTVAAAGTYYNDQGTGNILETLVTGLNAAESVNPGASWALTDSPDNSLGRRGGYVLLTRTGLTGDVLDTGGLAIPEACARALGISKAASGGVVTILASDAVFSTSGAGGKDFVFAGDWQRSLCWLPKEPLIQSEPMIKGGVDVATNEVDSSYYVEDYGDFIGWDVIVERVAAPYVYQKYTDNSAFAGMGSTYGLATGDEHVAYEHFWRACKNLLGAVRLAEDVDDRNTYLSCGVSDEDWLKRLAVSRVGRAPLRFDVQIPLVPV